ncbi:hypothetical protein G3T36_04375 [Diaminobutyricibacter tongyongensis]|uniref:Uncharacterized protein n=1 Tax=Leifsonia tongyongensis TaxID=1268043 RepID=A0A6L9XUN6_9MICO|nr:hypothetical protein [Diaminobutyricibacter tongyongensis]NEN05102.1 hypothetical protein [Diaminobutyricibacter tongyongensis]
MNCTSHEAPVSLVLEQDVPVRMTWNGQRFYVVGTAHPLDAMSKARKDSAYGEVTAWRFQATTAGGESHTFDIVSPGNARWNLGAVRP